MNTGITQEMGDDGDTVLCCLREVDHSRPYFVGILGERYGWHQEREDGRDVLLNKSLDKAQAEYP